MPTSEWLRSDVPKPILEVEGAAELRKTMLAAGQDLSDLTKANKEVAAQVVAAVHAPRRSGALAGSVRGSGTKSGAIVRAGGARLPYAGPIHYGWRARNITPQPFLTDAAHNTEPAWVGTYNHAVDQILAKIKGA
jgi:hypothetical protein